MSKFNIVRNFQPKSRLGVLTHTASGYFWEKEPDWNDRIISSSDMEIALKNGEQAVLSLGWGCLGGLAAKLASSRLQPEHLGSELSLSRPMTANWKDVVKMVSEKVKTSRPSRRKAAALSALHAADRWLTTGSPMFVQALDFNRIFPSETPAGQTYLPSKTFLLRGSRSPEGCASSSPRFRPSLEEMTGGLHSYEGLCEVLWESTRAADFECWRAGGSPPTSKKIAQDEAQGVFV